MFRLPSMLLPLNNEQEQYTSSKHPVKVTKVLIENKGDPELPKGNQECKSLIPDTLCKCPHCSFKEFTSVPHHLLLVLLQTEYIDD